MVSLRDNSIQFFDSHAHQCSQETGGFYIGQEGLPAFDGVMKNRDAVLINDVHNYKIGVEYVCSGFQQTHLNVVKYHPRREKYTKDQVISDIASRRPKLVIIDTLNQPFWQPLDYWKVAMAFPEIVFLMAHAGGYDVHEFVKMAHFTPNIFIDFSFTQHVFGVVGKEPTNKFIKDVMCFAVNNKVVRKKVLYGSDLPFASQEEGLDFYAEEAPFPEEIFCENFKKIIHYLLSC